MRKWTRILNFSNVFRIDNWRQLVFQYYQISINHMEDLLQGRIQAWHIYTGSLQQTAVYIRRVVVTS